MFHELKDCGFLFITYSKIGYLRFYLEIEIFILGALVNRCLVTSIIPYCAKYVLDSWTEELNW